MKVIPRTLLAEGLLYPFEMKCLKTIFLGCLYETVSEMKGLSN